MEHFCTLFIFCGLFFQAFGHSVYANSHRKTDILQNRWRYIQYMTAKNNKNKK